MPLTLNANLNHITVLLSFSRYRSCLCLAFMLTCISCSTEQLHIIFLWVYFPEMCIFFFWRRVIFILNSALPSRLDTSPHLLSSSAFIYHTPLNGHKHSVTGTLTAAGQLRCVICFVRSSYLSWWRSIEEAGWNGYLKTDVLLNSSSFVLWTRQCLFGSRIPRTQGW